MAPYCLLIAIAWPCAAAKPAQPGRVSDGLLAAYYPFDAGSGEIARDASAAAHHARLHGVTWAKGYGGSAIEIDGKAAHVDCGPTDRLKLTNRLTLSVWVHPKAIPAGEVLIAGESPGRWAITHYKGRVYFYVSGGHNYCRASVTNYQWSHVVGVFDGATMRLYVDGRAMATRELPANTLIKTGPRFRVGGANRKGACFKGLVDDLRVYSRALSRQEIAMLSARPGSQSQALRVNPDGEAEATRFFNTHADPVAFRRLGPQLLLANRHMGIAVIEDESAFHLARVFGVAASHDFVSPVGTRWRDGFWRLILRRDRGRDPTEVAVTSSSGARVSSRLLGGADSRTLRLRWEGLAVADEPNVLDVEVAIAVAARDALSRWRIRVANRSRAYGLWKVAFPRVELVPLASGPKKNYFAFGKSRGVVVPNPFHCPTRSSFGIGAAYGCFWPGTLNMQFQALYSEAGRGLYMATHDGGGHRKVFYFAPYPDEEVIRHSVEHCPANMGYAGEDYEMPYDFCMGPFEGDWYDACQIYRNWALGQRWCERGPLATRPDIPQWFKQAPIMLSTLTMEGDSRVVESRDRMLAFLRAMGTELPACWYTWKKHFPKMTHYNREGSPWRVPEARPYPCGNIHDGNYPMMPALPTFAPACKAIRRAGGHVKAYVCSRIYDPGLNENAPLAAAAKPHAVRKVDGNIKLAERNLVSWSMCYHTKWWQQRMKETVTELVRREHVGGIYFDTFYGGYVQCFDTSHGHSHGGGDDPYRGARRLSHVVRGAMKAEDPEAVMSGESPSETAIDLLDGFLYRDTVWPDMAPLFATVYGDYICRFGISLVPESPGFYVQCATLFTEGAQMGRLRLNANIDYVGDPEYKEQMAFLRNLASYWQLRAAGRYLAHGQLLRPLRFDEPHPMPTVSYTDSRYKRKYKSGLITAGVLQTGVFGLRDGSLGVLVVNVSDQPISFEFALTPHRYPMSPDARYAVSRVDASGTARRHTEPTKGQARVRDVAARHKALFFMVTRVDG